MNVMMSQLLTLTGPQNTQPFLDSFDKGIFPSWKSVSTSLEKTVIDAEMECTSLEADITLEIL